jgi:hypothetical protein
VDEQGTWELPFDAAIEVVRRGVFDEVKDALEALDFVFKETKDPNHWLYFHPLLREDALFCYPRNLYRPHGTRRSSDRISRHDQSQARQMIQALRVVRSFSQYSSGGDQ